MRRSVRRQFLLLFLVLLSIWGIFSTLTARSIDASEKTRLNLAADRIMQEIGDAFDDLERLSFVIAHHEDVLGMLNAQDLAEYYRMAQKAEYLVRQPAQRPDFISQVILYNGQGQFYRLSGDLSNTACTRIWYIQGAEELPTHFVSLLDGVKHIGYAATVNADNGTNPCLVALLFEEDVLLNHFEISIGEEPLDVALMANGEIIGATLGFDANAHIDPEGIMTASNAKAIRHIGVTPFKIIVVGSRHVSLPTVYFVLSAAVSAAVLGALFFFFARMLNQRFFTPMFLVMQRVAHLDVDMPGVELAQVNNAEFDALVDNINVMLRRLATKNEQIKEAELRTKNAEAKRQAAMIVSLKKQINAHFTINTLSSVKTLIEQAETERARAMLTKLSTLVRYAHDKDEYINAWEEFSVLENYIDIMNVRYGNAIQYIFDLDDRLMYYRMPRMLLQPIVENAILHGFLNRHTENQLQITAKLDETAIEITISDNGWGIRDADLKALNVQLEGDDTENLDGIEHIALLNIQRRIVSYYGSDGKLTVESVREQGASVRIVLPRLKLDMRV